jgi:hypothetical protein
MSVMTCLVRSGYLDTTPVEVLGKRGSAVRSPFTVVGPVVPVAS